MAVDTPAVIAILGAGPIGLETALYARYLGYDVIVFERGEVAEHVRRWGHVRMLAPFKMNRSPLGLAAVRLLDENYVPPGDEELLTGSQWRERYLLPLANFDLIVDHLRLQREVLGVTRTEILKTDLVGNPERGDWMFRILSRDLQGNEFEDEAEIVIDTTGVYSQPNWAGEGGLPALGEMKAREVGAIQYDMPDIAGADREQYAGKRTLVIGDDLCAAMNLVALAQLAEKQPDTQVTWLVQRAEEAEASPFTALEALLPEGKYLFDHVRQWMAEGKLRLISGQILRQVVLASEPDSPMQVTFGHELPTTEAFDRIIANTGFRPDRRMYEELQVDECVALQGPAKFAAALGQCSAGGKERTKFDPEVLLTAEPNFYILGSKSYGRRGDFLFADGLRQIRDLFSMIGERENLDLYANAPPVP